MPDSAPRWGMHLTAIRFFGLKDGPYRCFSNMFVAHIDIDGVAWPTVEHFYQAQKFPGTALATRIATVTSPFVAKKLGRTGTVRPDWEGIKAGVMRRGVWAKFEAYPALADVLVGTGSTVLIEDAATDYYWGCGAAMTGQNMLGIILMETRARLHADRVWCDAVQKAAARRLAAAKPR